MAESYDRYRPPPPYQAVVWMLPEPVRTALDLGAGTGGLTRLLARRSKRTVACEPDARMRAVLANRSEGVSPIGAVGEALPLVDGCLDAVLVSSAWHWMEPGRAVPEVARVLRSGGVLGALWNGPDRRVPWVEQVLGPWRGLGEAQPSEGRMAHELMLPPEAPFGAVASQIVEWSIEVQAEALVGLATTYSRMIVLPAAERAQRLDEVRSAVSELLPVPGQTLELPLRCRCWRAVRS